MHWDEGVNISTLEIGESLNSSPKCNTNYASGFEEKFTDAFGGGVNFPFTDTATANAKDSSNNPLRMVITGSEITKSCQSKYGVQDHIGNMAEATIDKDVFHIAEENNNIFSQGVSNVANPIEIKTFTLLRYDDFMPTFLGVDGTDGDFDYVKKPVGRINNSTLENDFFDASAASDNFNNDIIVGGGSYQEGNAAGVFRVEFSHGAQIQNKADIGYRCVIPLREDTYFEKVDGGLNY